MHQLRVAHVAVHVALVRSASGVSICTFVLVKKVNCRVAHAAVLCMCPEYLEEVVDQIHVAAACVLKIQMHAALSY